MAVCLKCPLSPCDDKAQLLVDSHRSAIEREHRCLSKFNELYDEQSRGSGCSKHADNE